MIPSSRHLPKLTARFFRTEGGAEPVREWLKGLPADDRKRAGDEIRKVQFGWPGGMPLVRKLGPELWEVRVRLEDGSSRTVRFDNAPSWRAGDLVRMDNGRIVPR